MEEAMEPTLPSPGRVWGWGHRCVPQQGAGWGGWELASGGILVTVTPPNCSSHLDVVSEMSNQAPNGCTARAAAQRPSPHPSPRLPLAPQKLHPASKTQSTKDAPKETGSCKMQQFMLCLQLPGPASSCCPALARRSRSGSARAPNSISAALNAPWGPAGGKQPIPLNEDICCLRVPFPIPLIRAQEGERVGAGD